MLPGLGVTEIIALAVLALLVVGPKDLPLMMRKLGKWMAKLRAMANEFRTGFDELARQAELDELKREVEALRRSNPLNELRTPLQDLNRDISRSVSAPSAAAIAAPSALPNLPPDPGPTAVQDGAPPESDTPDAAQPAAHSPSSGGQA
jgi:sec-independent protein translocase protein TatB